MPSSAQHPLRGPALFLLALVLAAYLPSLQNGFVGLDDPLHVTENPHVLAGLTLEGIAWALSNTHAGYWLPLTFISHMLDVQVFGLNPAGHHAVNLILHCVNVLLLFSCLLALTKFIQVSARPGAIPVPWLCLTVAALFGLHPIHVESVAWITERKDVLSTLFWLLAVYAYAWHVRAPSAARMGVVSLCMALGLMAKPMLVTLPFTLLLLDYWPLGRMPNSPCPDARKTSWHALILEKAPLFALTAFFSILTTYTQKNFGAMAPWSEWGLWQRITTALAGYLGYLEKAFWPAGLAAHYPLRDPVPILEWGLGLVLLACGTCLAYLMRRRSPYALVGWLWLLGTLVPVIGLKQSGMQAMADRFAYIPFIGLYIVVVWGVATALEHLPRGRSLGLTALVLLCLTLTGLTWKQTQYWRDSVTLFTRIVEVNPEDYRMRDRLGFYLLFDGDLDASEAQLQKVLQDHPEYAPSLTWLGVIHSKRGEHEKALDLLEKSMAINPDTFETNNALGLTLAALGRFEEATEYMRKALELEPDFQAIKDNLAVIKRILSTQEQGEAVQE